MNDKITKTFLDNLYNIPPIMRYPTLLMLAEIVAEELPKAETLYEEEKWRVLEDFNKFVSKRVESIKDE